MTVEWIVLVVVVAALTGGLTVYAYGRGEYASFYRSLTDEERIELSGYLTGGGWREYQKFHSARAAEREAERRDLVDLFAKLDAQV